MRISIKYSVPLALFIFSFVMSIWGGLYNGYLMIHRVEKEFFTNYNLTMNHLQEDLEHAFSEFNRNWAQELLVSAGCRSYIKKLQVVDHKGEIIMSINRAEIGNMFGVDEKERKILKEVSIVKKTMTGSLFMSDDRYTLFGVFPVKLERSEGDLRLKKTGFLRVNADMCHEKQFVWRRLIKQALHITIVITIFTLLLWMFFHLKLTRRINYLIEATKLVGIGSGLPIDTGVTGSDEIAELARSLEKMAEQRLSAEQKVKLANENLEHQVRERTADLVESKRAMHALVRNLPGMAYRRLNDEHWTMKFISDGCFDITGYKPLYLFDNKYISYVYLINDDDRKVVCDNIQTAVRNHGGYELTYRLKNKDGEEKWMWERGQGVYDSDNMLIALEGFINDITANKKAQVELQEAKAAAEAANYAKDQFLANMTHELRTPLNAIIGFSDIMKIKVTEPQSQGWVDSISKAGHSLLNLVNDILDLTKMETGKMENRPTSVSLKRLIHEIHSVFSPSFENKGVKFSYSLMDSVPAALLIDENKLTQVLNHLVSNAEKFTQTGSVKISVRCCHTDRINDSSYEINICVEDTGIGIPDEYLESVFEPFIQVNRSVMQQQGTGLGLTVTKRFVEMMNGTISIASAVGHGTKVFVTLYDIEKTVCIDSINNDEKMYNSANLTFEPALIEIVDDVPHNRELLESFLDEWDFSFTKAQNGKEAIELVHAKTPDLILMDIKMPVMDGKEATEILKTDNRYKDIPIIAISASLMYKEEVELSGICDALLQKPVSQRELVSELMKYLPHTIAENLETVDPEDTQTDLAKLDEDLTGLSENTISELRGALECGHAQTITTITNEISVEHPYIAKRMKRLSDDFAYESILKLLNDIHSKN